MASRLEWNADSDPAQRAARVVALDALDDVADAEDRVKKSDPESVHKFRVSLRSLRSWLRVYSPCLSDTVRKRTSKRLRRIADATTELRDLDVQIRWLRTERLALGDSRLAAAQWIRSTLKAERKRSWRRFKTVWARDFDRATNALRAELEHYTVTRLVRQPGDEDRMGIVSTRLMGDQAEALATALSRVRSADDAKRLHRARIVAKQARYCLALLGEHSLAAATLGDELERFQNLVGDLRDAQLLAHRVSREVTRIAAQRTAIVASELTYRPSGAMDFVRVMTNSPIDASLALLFARLHDRIWAASRAMVSWLGSDASARLVTDIRAAAARLGDVQ